jgi:phospholipid-translocating ATPase
MGKEAYDDYQRHLRDREANSQKYLILEGPNQISADDIGPHTRSVPSSSLRIGDLVHLEKNQRVPADLVLLRTSDASGTCFIRTDQLDGETDWKLRVAVPTCQKLVSENKLMGLDAEIYADGPIKDLNSFVGTFTINSQPLALSNEDDDVPLVPVPTVEPLTAENVLWSNTVLAAGSAVGFVVYTGSETRAVMNTSHPETKVGLLDLEITRLAKVCFCFAVLQA